MSPVGAMPLSLGNVWSKMFRLLLGMQSVSTPRRGGGGSADVVHLL